MHATTTSNTLCKRAIVVHGRALGARLFLGIVSRGKQVTSYAHVLLVTLPLEDGGEELAFGPIGLEKERAEDGLKGDEVMCEWLIWVGVAGLVVFFCYMQIIGVGGTSYLVLSEDGQRVIDFGLEDFLQDEAKTLSGGNIVLPVINSFQVLHVNNILAKGFALEDVRCEHVGFSRRGRGRGRGRNQVVLHVHNAVLLLENVGCEERRRKRHSVGALASILLDTSLLAVARLKVIFFRDFNYSFRVGGRWRRLFGDCVLRSFDLDIGREDHGRSVVSLLFKALSLFARLKTLEFLSRDFDDHVIMGLVGHVVLILDIGHLDASLCRMLVQGSCSLGCTLPILCTITYNFFLARVVSMPCKEIQQSVERSRSQLQVERCQDR